jgi:hypothetical protein
MAGGLHSSWPAKINGVSYEEKHSRGGETREENEEVARMCSPTADVKGGRRIFCRKADDDGEKGQLGLQ